MSVKIPYVDLAGQHRSLQPELLESVQDVLASGKFVLGPKVEQFEQAFAKLCGVRYSIGVNSGTDALILALTVLGVGPGDEVITVPNSYITTATSIIRIGAKPVFVDVGADYNIDIEKIESSITPKTKAILPVHLTGNPCQIETIVDIANKYNIAVIEDCAQAVKAEYDGQPVGSFGKMGCFSFHPLKTLSACGDAGALVTNDSKLYEKLLQLRNNGMLNRVECVEWSGNSRLDSIQAAILLVKLNYLAAWTDARIQNAMYYRSELSSISQITLPPLDKKSKAVYHTFVIQAERRDELRDYLNQHGVGSAIHYPVPIHLQSCAESLGCQQGDFPVTEEQARHILTLPIYPELKQSQLAQVVDTIKSFYQ